LSPLVLTYALCALRLHVDAIESVINTILILALISDVKDFINSARVVDRWCPC
jgi:hypothetical protein